MTKKEADFIGSMNMCDEISNEAYKKIMCNCEDEEPKTDVLDKIRAEIIQMPTISSNANDIYKADVLAIIDKYKAESGE
jgi:hypothetical protein